MAPRMTGEPESVATTRWPGKPTSGRLVYRGRETGRWYWQCDLHPEDWAQPDQWGMHRAWGDALTACLAHAQVCPFVSASVR